MTKKGQLSIINIISFVVLVLIASVASFMLNPIIAETIADATGFNDTLSVIVLNLLVPALWITVFATIFIYGTPQRPQTPY